MMEVTVENSKGSDTKETNNPINTKKIEVETISLNEGTLSIEEEEEGTLLATILPDNATDKSITWTSSNEEVATVDSTGKVTAISKGTALITAKANGGNSIETTCNINVTSSKLPYRTPYIPNGFVHTEGTWNNGFTIKGVEENPNDEFVWVPCVLEQKQIYKNDSVVIYGRNLNYSTDLSGFADMDSSASEIRASVGTHGGFYIAKYEAGIEGTKANGNLSTRKPTDGSIKPLSQPGKGVWNLIMRGEAITVSKAMINQTNTGVKSTLISGPAWDTTMQWMVNASDNKDNEPNKNYDINSTNKGWYGKSTATTTGYYAVNNIYDMAGNMDEWSTENCSGSYWVVARGGNISKGRPASGRGGYGNGNASIIGFRVVLYK